MQIKGIIIFIKLKVKDNYFIALKNSDEFLQYSTLIN